MAAIPAAPPLSSKSFASLTNLRITWSHSTNWAGGLSGFTPVSLQSFLSVALFIIRTMRAITWVQPVE